MDTENQRQVKGIWIPIEIWKATNMSWNEKILLLEIDSFTRNGAGCCISNEYISEMFGVTDRIARGYLYNLIKLGLVETVRFDGRRRWIASTLQSVPVDPDTQQPGRVAKNSQSGWLKTASQGGQKQPHNNKEEQIILTNKDTSYPPLPPLEPDSRSATEQEMFENRYSGPEMIDELELVLPFKSKAFSEAWKKLLRQPKWRGRSRDSLEANLEILKKHTEKEALDMINDAIAGGYQKLVEPKKEKGTRATSYRSDKIDYEKLRHEY